MNKRGQALNKTLLREASELIFVGIVILAMWTWANGELHHETIEKNYLVRDNAILLSTLQASPNPITYTYTFNTLDATYEETQIALSKKEDTTERIYPFRSNPTYKLSGSYPKKFSEINNITYTISGNTFYISEHLIEITAQNCPPITQTLIKTLYIESEQEVATALEARLTREISEIRTQPPIPTEQSVNILFKPKTTSAIPDAIYYNSNNPSDKSLACKVAEKLSDKINLIPIQPEEYPEVSQEHKLTHNGILIETNTQPTYTDALVEAIQEHAI